MEPGQEEEIKTIFLSGLPHDATYREVYLLCRNLSGYEGCNLRQTGTAAPVAFCVFDCNANAQIAMDGLQGVSFDPESTIVLRTEMAKVPPI